MRKSSALKRIVLGCFGMALAAAWLPAMVAPVSAATSREDVARKNKKKRAAIAQKKKLTPPPSPASAPTSIVKRKPTLLPAAQRRTRSSTPPPLTRESPGVPRRAERQVVPTPLPPAFDPPGDRGPPLGTPPHLDPRYQSATPPIGTPPLPPARQVPGESGIPLGPGPLSPVR